jgi:hypothetical protein
MPKTSALTPPLGTWKGIPIHRSRRYSCLEYICFFITDCLVNREPLCKVPQDMNPIPSAKSVPVSDESVKVDNPPSPQVEKTTPEPSKPLSSTGAQGPIAAGGGTPTSPIHTAPGQDAADNSPRLQSAARPEMPPPNTQSHGLGTPGGSQNNRDHIHVL